MGEKYFFIKRNQNLILSQLNFVDEEQKTLIFLIFLINNKINFETKENENYHLVNSKGNAKANLVELNLYFY